MKVSVHTPITVVKSTEFGEIKRTRYRELSYQRQGQSNWRFLANDTGRVVGPSYVREGELLADLERYAKIYGAS